MTRWLQTVPILYNGTSLPPKNYPFPWGIWTPSNTWFPGHTQVLNPNGISINSAVFAGLTNVTDRTDHATRSVTICHIYVRSTAMRALKLQTCNGLHSNDQPCDKSAVYMSIMHQYTAFFMRTNHRYAVWKWFHWLFSERWLTGN